MRVLKFILCILSNGLFTITMKHKLLAARNYVSFDPRGLTLDMSFQTIALLMLSLFCKKNVGQKYIQYFSCLPTENFAHIK